MRMLKYAQTDLQDAVKCGWDFIPKHVKLAFGFALLTNFFIFFYELAQFPIGDHDVGYMSGITLLSGGRAGRWFAPALHLVSGHLQLPVYTQFFAFIALIASGMAAVALWRPQATFLPLFAGGVFVSCMPVVTDYYYYHWMALSFTCSQLFMVLALHCSFMREKQTHMPLWRWLGAIVLCICAMASYQSSVITWSVCFVGLCIVCILQWDGTRSSFVDITARLVRPFAAMCIACILYALSLRLYPLVGLSLELYQFNTLSLSDMPKRIVDILYYSYIHLFTPQQFMPPYLMGLLFCTFLLGSIFLMYDCTTRTNFHFIKIILVCLFIFLLPIAAKAQFFISSGESWFSARFAGFGLSYVYLFFLVALLSASVILVRNVGLILLILILPVMAINCLNEQVQLVRSNQHDLSVFNRVIDRIEQHPLYDPDKTYNLVQLGRTRAYEPRGNVPATWGQLNVTLSQAWNPGFELWLLSSYLKLGDRLNEEAFKRPDLLAKALEYVEGKKPFPHPESIGIVDDTIVLYFDTAALALARTKIHGSSLNR